MNQSQSHGKIGILAWKTIRYHAEQYAPQDKSRKRKMKLRVCKTVWLFHVTIPGI